LDVPEKDYLFDYFGPSAGHPLIERIRAHSRINTYGETILNWTLSRYDREAFNYHGTHPRLGAFELPFQLGVNRLDLRHLTDRSLKG
jgi:hypothetical protein